MKFEKLQGAGNDFIIINGFEEKPKNWNWVARKVCDRNFGVGADGFIFCSESDIADVKMNFYNSDGTRAEMCGNGIRCFAKYVYDNRIVRKKNMAIETDAGIKIVKIKCNNKNKIESLSVNMGKVNFNATSVPCIAKKETLLNETFHFGNMDLKVSSVLMGVPHTVIFLEDYENFDINKVGKTIENHVIFPKKTNVNFVKKLSEDTIQIKTWERGAGRTLGCGTGSSAAAAVAHKLGIISKNKIKVLNDGGELIIKIGEDYSIELSGKAHTICSGEYLGVDY